MAYSNVTPPKLPEYDSVAYPYYVLVYNYEKGSEDWYQVHLYYSDTAFSYDGSYVTNAGAVTKCVYDVSGGVWTDPAALASAPQITYGLTGSVYQRIYTNHDILDGEGNVWLAADSVTAVETAWAGLKSWLLGYALGLAGKPLPISSVRKWETLFDGDITATEQTAADGTTYGISQFSAVLELPSIGSYILRLTVDGAQSGQLENIYPYTTGTVYGNPYLYGLAFYDGTAPDWCVDTGYDYCLRELYTIASGEYTPYFIARTAGTYHLKIERLVT